MVDLIFFSILAVILVFKLRSIIGKENTESPSTGEGSGSKRSPIDITLEAIRYKSGHKNGATQKEVVIELIKPPVSYSYNPDISSSSNVIADSAIGSFELIKQVLGVDEFVFVQEFGEVFMRIVDSYSSGDLDPISSLVSNDIFDSMLAAIRQGKAVNAREYVTVVRILRIFIEDVNVKGDVASVSLVVDSEQISYIADSDGKVIQGDSSRPYLVKEGFTVVRRMRQDGSSWVVSEIRGLS